MEPFCDLKYLIYMFANDTIITVKGSTVNEAIGKVQYVKGMDAQKLFIPEHK